VLETDEERSEAWRPVLAGAVIVPTFAIALAGVLTTGPYAFGLLLLMAPLIRLARRLAPRPPAFLIPARGTAPVGTLEAAAES
jgi:hypothetical protein